jgi:hypothetical protein
MRRDGIFITLAAFAALAALAALPARAQETQAPAAASDSAAELAKKLANPIASLISVPFQSNWDVGLGSANGSRLRRPGRRHARVPEVAAPTID